MHYSCTDSYIQTGHSKHHTEYLPTYLPRPANGKHGGKGTNKKTRNRQHLLPCLPPPLAPHTQRTQSLAMPPLTAPCPCQSS